MALQGPVGDASNPSTIIQVHDICEVEAGTDRHARDEVAAVLAKTPTRQAGSGRTCAREHAGEGLSLRISPMLAAAAGQQRHQVTAISIVE